jgi:hypothetical protein
MMTTLGKFHGIRVPVIKYSNVDPILEYGNEDSRYSYVSGVLIENSPE